jgi:hypothetical protein
MNDGLGRSAKRQKMADSGRSALERWAEKPDVRFRPSPDVGTTWECRLIASISLAPRSIDQLAAFDAMRGRAARRTKAN